MAFTPLPVADRIKMLKTKLEALLDEAGQVSRACAAYAVERKHANNYSRMEAGLNARNHVIDAGDQISVAIEAVANAIEAMKE